MSTKDTNPKDGIGSRKAPLSVLSFRVLYEIALGMLEGAIKYRRHNYRIFGVRSSVYTDAAMRHIAAFQEGEDIDPVSGLHHITKAMSSLHVLRDAQLCNKCIDDRPPALEPGWLEDMNDKDAALIDKMERERGKPAELPHTEVEEKETRRKERVKGAKKAPWAGPEAVVYEGKPDHADPLSDPNSFKGPGTVMEVESEAKLLIDSPLYKDTEEE